MYGITLSYFHTFPFHDFTWNSLWFRMQPQFRSHVYRSVLLSPVNAETEASSNQGDSRGDLIVFYNRVFVPLTKSHAAR